MMTDLADASSTPAVKAHEPQISRMQGWIAALALAGIALHLILRVAAPETPPVYGTTLPEIPLLIVLAFGGIPLALVLVGKVIRGEFGSDMLAGISIVASALLDEYLAGALVVLMLSGGEALEAYAIRNASSVLQALAKRMPTRAHRRENGNLADVSLESVQAGDTLVVFPHEICPVDGRVVSGHGTMDESYLTGEPYHITKAPGTEVLSGAINGDTALTIECIRPASDSRYARIMQVMRESEQRRPRLRRLGDQLGALYTPIAVVIALGAWGLSGDPIRFLSVLVVATPCPLLIAIPVAIIGSISLAARHAIIIKDPVVLEKISECRVAIFDKTGTLTYGRPKLTEILTAEGFPREEVLALAASLEQYSKHPLAGAILEAAAEAGLRLQDADEVREMPGEGIRGRIGGRQVFVTGRDVLAKLSAEWEERLPEVSHGLECVTLVDGEYAATFRFRDEMRPEGAHFVRHLSPQHGFDRSLLVSGDREVEVAYLAERVGITEVYAGQSPEQKLALVEEETRRAPTVFLGDGINDAPALTAATVGIAFGSHSEITGEAADAVILDSALEKVDVLMHIGERMRRIALQSALGGMALSVVGMGLAAMGMLPPVAGALMQEIIDVFAVLNALRAALPPRSLSDYATH
jgi:heavy metal translocating P-type ATPase